MRQSVCVAHNDKEKRDGSINVSAFFKHFLMIICDTVVWGNLRLMENFGEGVTASAGTELSIVNGTAFFLKSV